MKAVGNKKGTMGQLGGKIRLEKYMMYVLVLVTNRAQLRLHVLHVDSHCSTCTTCTLPTKEIHYMGLNPPVEVLRQENGSLVLIGAVWVWGWIFLCCEALDGAATPRGGWGALLSW